MSSFFRLTAIVAVAALLSGCEGPNRYPVSGEECGPDDPVKTIDSSVSSCMPSSS